MTDSPFQLHACGHSDKGLFRKNNQDFFDIQKQFAVVADGLGGHKAGEVASQLAVNKLVNQVHLLEELEEESQVSQNILSLVKKISREIFDQSLNNPEQKGMGTTIASFWMQKDRCAIFHVGDSRVFLYRNQKLNLLTQDHANEVSVDEDQLGEIRRRYLTQAIGTTPDCEARIHFEIAQNNDRYILCSDGLTDYVTTKEIELLLLKNQDATKATHALIDAALSRGGRDNITVVVLDILATQPES